MKLTKELLIKHDACKDGIDFFERNKLEGFPLSRLDEIKGGFEGYIGWVEDTNFSKLVKPSELIKHPRCTYDENGNELSYENGKGFWWKKTYDGSGNELSHENSDGYWWKSTYDKNGNKLSHENSDGFWSKRTYDSRGNQLSFENSDGYWSKSTYDSRGNELSYENSGGSSKTYTYLYYPNKQLKSIHKNGIEMLYIPLI